MGQSRWVDQFTSHPFQAIWSALKSTLESVEIDDQTITTSVAELGRLKRVVAYLDRVIEAVDPELTPQSVWNNFQPQADACLNQIRSYVANKNIQHITQANEHADNLLTYVRPYLVLPVESLEALKDSTRAYTKQLLESVDAFRVKASETTAEISTERDEVAAEALSVRKYRARIESFHKQALEGDDATPAIKTRLDDLVVKASSVASEIEAFHATLIVGSASETSTQAKVKAAASEVQSVQDRMSKLLIQSQEEVDALDGFYYKIFGTKDEESGKSTGGLESELEARMVALKQLEVEQQNKHGALFIQIESLLPGATSAGLASAYMALKDSFTQPIKNYTLLFYGALGLLVIGALVLVIDRVTLSPTVSIFLIQAPEWDSILKNILYKTPFIAPVVWLALFSSKRRSQYERLQQEYAHKEALARSYESYKKQVQDLKGESEALQRALIERSIEAIAHNASATLDGKHDDHQMPSQELLNRLTVDDLKAFFERVTEAWGKSKKPT